MKITLCGSIAFYDEMLNIKKRLESLGHEIKLPPDKVKNKEGDLISVSKYYELRKNTNDSDGWIWERKKEAMLIHFDKINWSEKILVTNYDKKGIKNYIGGNTFLEMGLALWLKKGIYLLNSVPEVDYKEEIIAMEPIVINNNLTNI